MKTISRPDDLRRENQRRILVALRGGKSRSRKELAALTGLSAATLTAITGQLLDAGYLVVADDGNGPEQNGGEASPGMDPVAGPTGTSTVGTSPAATGNGRRGRPQVALALNPAAGSIAALTLTLNHLSASLVDYSGIVIAERHERIDTLLTSGDDLGLKLAALLEHVTGSAPGATGPLLHIMLTVQGVTTADGSVMQWTPITRDREVRFGAMLEEKFKVPVTLANDANMIATALKQNEPQRYDSSFAAILLSHGIGMGLYLKGRLFTGIRTSAAEFGHTCHVTDGALCRCGRHGCIEAYAGDYGIWRTATGFDPMRMPDKDIGTETMADLARRARDGDREALHAYQQAGVAIGQGLRNLFALFDPFPVAFTGSGVLAFELMEPMIRQSLGRRAVGLSHGDARIDIYPDDFLLTRQGTIHTALVHVDRSIQIGQNGHENAQARYEKAS